MGKLFKTPTFKSVAKKAIKQAMAPPKPAKAPKLPRLTNAEIDEMSEDIQTWKAENKEISAKMRKVKAEMKKLGAEPGEWSSDGLSEEQIDRLHELDAEYWDLEDEREMNNESIKDERQEYREYN